MCTVSEIFPLFCPIPVSIGEQLSVNSILMQAAQKDYSDFLASRSSHFSPFFSLCLKGYPIHTKY
jgi:hypothetical protein